MKRVVVTGASGQLGKCLQDAAEAYPNWEFTFLGREALDISQPQSIEKLFRNHSFDYCINAAAYTHVDHAEKEQEEAYLGNAKAPRLLAEACQQNEVVLFHISTDYVFDGTKGIPYQETDPVGPINVYGASKLKGEEHIQDQCPKHFIVRTSWLYSQYGHNFFKSILRLAKERDELTITTEQTGVPTNANDLAEALLQMIAQPSERYGIYHFSNVGPTTWYEFAKAIVKHAGLSDQTKVKEIDKYPTFAQRPNYSVMDVSKIKNEFNCKEIHWEASLKGLINSIEL